MLASLFEENCFEIFKKKDSLQEEGNQKMSR